MSRNLTMSEMMYLLEEQERQERQGKQTYNAPPPLPPRDPAHQYFRSNVQQSSRNSSLRSRKDRNYAAEREQKRRNREREERAQREAIEYRRRERLRDESYARLTGQTEDDVRRERNRADAYKELNGQNPWVPAGWRDRKQLGFQGNNYPGRASGLTMQEELEFMEWRDQDYYPKREQRLEQERQKRRR